MFYTNDKKLVVLGGYDIISYFTDIKPAKGSSLYQIEYKGVNWYFENNMNKNTFKKNPERFFNRVYATTVGNQWGNDGRIYRGRWYNQLTGKGNYKLYSELIGIDILQKPDLLNDPIVASKVALAFFTQGKNASDFPQFSTKNEAAIYFSDINAGGQPGWHRWEALQTAENFDIQTTIA